LSLSNSLIRLAHCSPRRASAADNAVLLPSRANWYGNKLYKLLLNLYGHER